MRRPAKWLVGLVILGAVCVAGALVFSVPILGLVLGPRFVLDQVRAELKGDPAALAVLDRERDVLRYIDRRIAIDKLTRREDIRRLVVGYTRTYASKSAAQIEDTYLYSWRGQTVHLFTLVYDPSGKFLMSFREE